MNVRNAVKEIHARIERESSAGSTSSAADDNDLASLRSACERLYRTRNLVGEMPPSPNTLRAWVGGHLVRLVQRMLFWYTPQVLQFHNETASAFSSACRLVERQSERIRDLQEQVTGLRRRLPGWSGSTAPQVVSVEDSAANALPPAFEFALQDHFRGSERDTEAKLVRWLDTITAHGHPGKKSAGPWLDVGCGRGEWLTLASRAGYQVIGIDPNPAAIEHCRSRKLPAEQAEALSWLEARQDGSLAGVTAFHVVEHLPMKKLLAFVSLVAQKLQPGGMLAIETPDPANLLMASHRFWNDPTHQRPVPADLLEFILRFFGLGNVKRLYLNPSPPEQHLPYADIDVIRRVDDLLYGPQDYGIIGCRES